MRIGFTYLRVAALIICDGAILLTPPWETVGSTQKLWNTPGGAVEPGESIEAALKREAFEEIGAVIEPQGVAFLTQNVSTEPGQNPLSLEVCCYARLVNDTIDLRPEHPYILPPMWVPIEQVPALPTLPFSLKGWAKTVSEMGSLPDAIPIAPVHAGSTLAKEYALFNSFWMRNERS